jgi:hypothetical protein
MTTNNRFLGALSALGRAIRAVVRAEKLVSRYDKPWNLQPDAWAAFEAAWAKRGLPAYKLKIRARHPSTSRGRNWCPRVPHCVVMTQPKTKIERLMPAKGYRMDERGTIWKLKPEQAAA